MNPIYNVFEEKDSGRPSHPKINYLSESKHHAIGIRDWINNIQSAKKM